MWGQRNPKGEGLGTTSPVGFSYLMDSYAVPEPGDHISVAGTYLRTRAWSLFQTSSRNPTKVRKYGLYRHHMLVINAFTSDNTFEVLVVHLTEGRCVEEEQLSLHPGKFRVHMYPCQYSGLEAIARAKFKVTGEQVYSLLSYNCEHFVRWAKTGQKECKQIRRIKAAGIGGASGAVTGGSAGACVGGTMGTVLVPIPVVGTVTGSTLGTAVGSAIGLGMGLVVGASSGFAGTYIPDRLKEK